MHQSPAIKRLVIATHNQGKLREFSDMLKPFFAEIVSAGELGLAEPEETGLIFAENALIKARAAAAASNTVALADDSGLCVVALDGAPGIYSARWGGPDKNFMAAMERVNNSLGEQSDRSAFFVCVLVLAWPDGQTRIFEGRVDGTIIWPPRGNHGHGYDPVFMPAGETRSFAEMLPEDKHIISHRGQAVRQLLDFMCSAR